MKKTVVCTLGLEMYAPINSMQSTAGWNRLPDDGLLEVQKQFGDTVLLNVMDYRNRDAPKEYAGWQHLDILGSEGSHEQILDKLRNALEQRRESGAITEGAYRQAAGITLDKDARGMAASIHGKHEANAPGRGLPAGNSEKALLGTKEPQKNAPERDQPYSDARHSKTNGAQLINLRV